MVARSSRGLHLRASAGDQLIVGAAGQEGVVATTRLEVDPLAAPRRREGGERRLAAPPRVLDRRPLSLFPRRPCARPRRRGADSSDPRGAKENPRGGAGGRVKHQQVGQPILTLAALSRCGKSPHPPLRGRGADRGGAEATEVRRGPALKHLRSDAGSAERKWAAPEVASGGREVLARGRGSAPLTTWAARTATE